MDPSMLVGFLIRDEEDWISWKAAVRHVQGKAIINVAMHDPAKGSAPGRAGAIDEVETISDNEDDETVAADEDDGDTVLAE
jgi:cysteine protease ATG4